MKATVIVDNVDYNGIPGEWGLSIICEYEGHSILLDAGASNLFCSNAEALGIDLSKVGYAVLSHAHYDHSNGMKKFFEINSKAQFYLRENALENCYFKKMFVRKYIGIPRNITSEFADRIVYVKGDYKLIDGVSLIGHHTPNLAKLGKREMMYQKTPSGFMPDDFSHEQSLVFDTEKGLVIFNSCSHGGAANIINEVSGVFPEKKVYGLVGGFHLYNKSEREVKELAEKINETGIEFVCTGHCTKDRAFEILKKELNGHVEKMHVGMEMVF